MNALPITGELFATNQVSPDTERCYRYQLRSFSRWMETERDVTDLDSVTTVDLLAYKQSLAHLSPTTQKRYMATIRSFFKWARESGLIETDPAAGVKLPRAIQGQAPTFFTLDETRTLIASVQTGRYGKRDAAMLWCFAHGLRVAEVTALNVGDVIQPENGGMAAMRVRGKGSKARTVSLLMDGYRAVTAYIGDRVGADTEPLLTCTYRGRTGRRMSRAGIQERFMVLAARAGIPADKRHPHCMRHGFATRMLFESSVPGGIYTVSKLLGHSRVATTEVYLHCSHKRLEAAMLADPLGAGV